MHKTSIYSMPPSTDTLSFVVTGRPVTNQHVRSIRPGDTLKVEPIPAQEVYSLNPGAYVIVSPTICMVVDLLRTCRNDADALELEFQWPASGLPNGIARTLPADTLRIFRIVSVVRDWTNQPQEPTSINPEVNCYPVDATTDGIIMGMTTSSPN